MQGLSHAPAHKHLTRTEVPTVTFTNNGTVSHTHTLSEVLHRHRHTHTPQGLCYVWAKAHLLENEAHLMKSGIFACSFSNNSVNIEYPL